VRQKVLASSFAVLCAIGASAQTRPSDAPPQAPAAASVQQGHELYLKYSCYACHGYDGHGGAGARLVPLAITEARFTAYVRNPRGRMPPYTDRVLSDAELADLLAYIKSLPASPSADQIPLLSRMMAAGR
jgi:mono/diheme cytochrome c family protein